MGCQWIRPDDAPYWLSDAYEDLFDNPLYAAWLRRTKRDRLIEPINTDGIFMCGRGRSPLPQCRCGRGADYLCDEPLGRGKTCDLPLCGHCRMSIGDDLDLCPVHATRQIRQPSLPWEED